MGCRVSKKRRKREDEQREAGSLGGRARGAEQRAGKGGRSRQVVASSAPSLSPPPSSLPLGPAASQTLQAANHVPLPKPEKGSEVGGFPRPAAPVASPSTEEAGGDASEKTGATAGGDAAAALQERPVQRAPHPPASPASHQLSRPEDASEESLGARPRAPRPNAQGLASAEKAASSRGSAASSDSSSENSEREKLPAAHQPQPKATDPSPPDPRNARGSLPTDLTNQDTLPASPSKQGTANEEAHGKEETRTRKEDKEKSKDEEAGAEQKKGPVEKRGADGGGEGGTKGKWRRGKDEDESLSLTEDLRSTARAGQAPADTSARHRYPPSTTRQPSRATTASQRSGPSTTSQRSGTLPSPRPRSCKPRTKSPRFRDRRDNSGRKDRRSSEATKRRGKERAEAGGGKSRRDASLSGAPRHRLSHAPSHAQSPAHRRIRTSAPKGPPISHQPFKSSRRDQQPGAAGPYKNPASCPPRRPDGGGEAPPRQDF